jgi:plasmid stabilization system protein ParE
VRVEWRPLANEDLAGIRRYVARDDKAKARRFGAELRQKVKLLSEHPQLGRPVDLEVPPGIRVLVLHENHLAYYRIVDAGGEQVVQVLRVKHAAQARV